MENLPLSALLQCSQGHLRMVTPDLPSQPPSFAGGLGMLPSTWMVEPMLARSPRPTKRLLAKTWLTNGSSSSTGGKVTPESHPTAPSEDRRADGGRSGARCPQGIGMGEPPAQLLPSSSCWGWWERGGSRGAAVMHSS